MLEELKKINFQSGRDEIIYFLCKVIGASSINRNDAIVLCNHAPGKSDELAGEKAELFVVKYEKKRLGVEGENKVKRISEIDVTAGYDIVSANSPNSTVANRFIEVKAVSENGFYWSKNEYDIAKLLAADYYLYLVDLSKIDDDNYEPDIIHNPVQHIMENNLWLVEPQSYHIQKVKF